MKPKNQTIKLNRTKLRSKCRINLYILLRVNWLVPQTVDAREGKERGSHYRQQLLFPLLCLFMRDNSGGSLFYCLVVVMSPGQYRACHPIYTKRVSDWSH